ncbi:sensor histidine kinase [Leptolyngbya sp. BL0902]|uniref:sensor histidine kinase n=1 Tax=Leptolyngbya sp. BL0902 TaxID=1115757 RepID=UPI0018E7221A|nr:HAMP domain-containing sensor histidine kinase [Leptolyngbya sp. BL0902]
MASDHSPVLFSVRSAGEAQKPVAAHLLDSQTIACQLLHTLAASLNTPYTLHQITEVLGSQLGADACLVLWHHRPTASTAYTCWQNGSTAQLWQLPSLGRSPQAALQHRMAQALIQQFSVPQGSPVPLPWRDALLALTPDHPQGEAWLAGIKIYRSIVITAAPDCEGVVVLLNRRRGPGLAVEEALAVNLASLVAVALHQHHLQQQTQQCNEQLRYLSYLKEDFLSTLNHELRTPLTSMMLAIRMLRRPDLTPERVAMYLDILEQQCSRETNLVNDLLMLQTVDAGTGRTQLIPVDLGQALTTLAQEIQADLAAVQLSLVVTVPQEPVRVLAAASPLTRIMQELLTNAQKYSASGSTVTITLLPPAATDAQAVVQISNVGAGIQADELAHIFEKFRRGRNATKDAIPGTGTGLALVRGLVEQLEGTITVTSEPQADHLWQTCFSLGFRRHRSAMESPPVPKTP